MLEGVKSRGLGVRVLLVMAAMVLAMFVANALYNAPGPLGTKKAEASHIAAWGTIQGTVYYSSGGSTWLARDVPVAVYRYEGSYSTGLCLTRTNSYGRYTCRNVGAGHYYKVMSGTGRWVGQTDWFPLAAGRVVTANVLLKAAY